MVALRGRYNFAISCRVKTTAARTKDDSGEKYLKVLKTP